MTTAPSEDVPRYFHDYALENEREHKELANRIDRLRIELSDRIDSVRTELGDQIASLRTEFSEVKGELRIIKAVSLGIFGTVLVAASKYVIGW